MFQSRISFHTLQNETRKTSSQYGRKWEIRSATSHTILTAGSIRDLTRMSRRLSALPPRRLLDFSLFPVNKIH